jgi:hypothetical protein
MAHRRSTLGFLESVAMRNALGLMLASVVAAVVIAGVWFWTSSPRAGAAPPQTVAAKPAEPVPAAAKLAAKDDVEVTAALSKPAAPPAPPPAPAKSTCANPDALGVSRTVVIDTTVSASCNTSSSTSWPTRRSC